MESCIHGFDTLTNSMISHVVCFALCVFSPSKTFEEEYIEAMLFEEVTVSIFIVQLMYIIDSIMYINTM